MTQIPDDDPHDDSDALPVVDPRSSEISQDYLYSSYLRSVTKRLIYFAEEIVGCIIDIHYPECAGRFICEVTEYNGETGWHKVKSTNSKVGAVNFESNTIEEDFTDEVDLNAFWRERRIQFIGKDDSPFLFCPVCKWQAAPLVSCIVCSDCGHLTHVRCAARASGIETLDTANETLEEYTCASCCRHSSRSPQISPTNDPSVSLTPPLSPTAATYDALQGWSDEMVKTVNSEFWGLQQPGARKVKFVSGTDYLQHLCNGSVNHAMTALQHCSTAGVLSWVYEDGSESENCRIIRRGLDQSDSSVQLLVCISDISPTNQARISFKPPSQAWCCHMTLGFVAISGLLKTARSRDSLRSQYAQILIFACRSTQVRSIDELHSVITERVWSNWTALDNSDGQLIDTIDQVSTHTSLVYTVNQIAAPCKTPEEVLAPTSSRSGRRGMAAAPPSDLKDKTTRQVLAEIYVPGGIRTRNGITTQSQEKVLRRNEWDPNRFTLVHRGLNHEAAYLASLPTPPSRLVFGASLRLLQLMGYRVVLLELALPISDEVRHHGLGRELEMVTSHKFKSMTRPGGRPVERDEITKNSDWPNYMPKMGDMVLAPTSNVPAYKTYRAFGLGEHCVWNSLNCNASPSYKYPVLGCVLNQAGAGGVTKERIHTVALRSAPAAASTKGGMNEWLPTLKKRKQEPSVVNRLLEGDSGWDQEFSDNLHLFETVLDHVAPTHLGVSLSDLQPAAAGDKSPARKIARTGR